MQRSTPKLAFAARLLVALLSLSLMGCGEDDTTGGPQTPKDEAAIFVSANGNDDLSGDSPQQAVKSITMGIARALLCSPELCEVRIEQGTYEEAVELASGVSLMGGYGSEFVIHDPRVHVTVITSTETRTVSAKLLDAPVLVDGVTIRGADHSLAKTPDGSSSFALWVSGSKGMITVANSVIEAGRGADGSDGAAGVELSCDSKGGSGGEATDCDAAKGGAGDAGQDDSSGGDGGEPGNNNCPNVCPLTGSDGISDGKQGIKGDDGDDGAAGSAAEDPLGSFSAGGEWTGAKAGSAERGKNGTSGGGGGAGGSKRFKACFGCGTLLGGHGGDGAKGGCGGGQGEAGTPGGGAFAVLINGGDLVLQDTEVRGGQGGKGGKGGDGMPGAEAGTDIDDNHEGAKSQKCGLINYSSGAGGLGGLGGKGGHGGGGAGGVGGPALSIVRVGDGALIEVGAVSIAIGKAGAGGLGGLGGSAPKGLAGSAALTGAF